MVGLEEEEGADGIDEEAETNTEKKDEVVNSGMWYSELDLEGGGGGHKAGFNILVPYVCICVCVGGGDPVFNSQALTKISHTTHHDLGSVPTQWNFPRIC